MTVFIALIRAIGPATHAKMSMKPLREACEAAGLEKVTTYIQTGNLIIGTRKSAAAVQAIVETVLKGFGLDNLVVLRRPEDIAAVIDANPFPEAAAARPGALAVCFLAATPSKEAMARLAHYEGPEPFKLIGRDLCIDYVNGVTGSKLLPGVIERRLATPGTARNWNTVRKLLTLAQAFNT